MADQDGDATDSSSEWNTFNVLIERFHNEDRVLAERTNFLLLGNSFLFVGFVTLDVTLPNVDIVRVTLPIVGLCLTMIGAYLNLLSTRTLSHFFSKMRDIRSSATALSYMREIGFDPNYTRSPLGLGRTRGMRQGVIFGGYLPLLMGAVWVSSLVWVLLPWVI